MFLVFFWPVKNKTIYKRFAYSPCTVFFKGYVVFGKEFITKHDAELCGRRNTARLENSFPTHFRTGDATGMDLQINNKIYNNLRRHAFSEEKR